MLSFLIKLAYKLGARESVNQYGYNFSLDYGKIRVSGCSECFVLDLRTIHLTIAGKYFITLQEIQNDSFVFFFGMRPIIRRAIKNNRTYPI